MVFLQVKLNGKLLISKLLKILQYKGLLSMIFDLDQLVNMMSIGLEWLKEYKWKYEFFFILLFFKVRY